MTSSIVVWPIIKALLAAGSFIVAGPNAWQAVNPKQQHFLDTHFANHNQVNRFSDTELRAWASRDYQELNGILEREQFSIQLEPFDPQGSFGVVSILDVQVEWLQAGSKAEMSTENDGLAYLYPAVKMEDDFAVYATGNYGQPIVSIPTKNGDTVWMAIADHDTPLQEFQLLEWIASVKRDRQQHTKRYSAVTFPMIDLDQKVNIKWLLKMVLMGLTQDWAIAQALQQTKFKMNEVGARVKSAVAIGLRETCCMPQEDTHIVLDVPFYLWIERPGVTDPIFAAYMSQDVWRDPKNLEL